MKSLGSVFAKRGTWALESVKWLGTSFKFVGKLIGFLGRFGIVRGKLLGPIGWVIAAFQAISTIIDYWSNAKGIFGSVMLIIDSIIDAILSPLYSLINFFSGSKI